MSSFAVGRQEILHNLIVCFLPELSRMHITSLLRRIILSSVACQAVPYLPHYLINDTILGEKNLFTIKCVSFIFSLPSV